MVLIIKLLAILTIEAACLYRPPFAPGKSFRVLQGFHGKYSHKPPLQFGVDIDMPEGTLVYAARAGKVDSVIDHYEKGGPNSKFIDQANKVVIDHGDGTFALYAHLKKNSARVKKGQQIEVGLPIARSGCTGWCDGPHLHFEIFKKNPKEERGRESIPFKLGCLVPNLGPKISN